MRAFTAPELTGGDGVIGSPASHRSGGAPAGSGPGDSLASPRSVGPSASSRPGRSFDPYRTILLIIVVVHAAMVVRALANRRVRAISID